MKWFKNSIHSIWIHMLFDILGIMALAALMLNEAMRSNKTELVTRNHTIAFVIYSILAIHLMTLIGLTLFYFTQKKIAKAFAFSIYTAIMIYLFYYTSGIFIGVFFLMNM